jgi:hypothetical protein
MSLSEVNDLREMIRTLDLKIDSFDERTTSMNQKLDIITNNLRRCQTRCHVDNPPGRWRGLARAIAALFQKHQLTMENADAK